MKQLLVLLNEMLQNGLIGNYALGGATALIHYFEPIQTQDIDVFVVLTNQKDDLVNPSSIEGMGANIPHFCQSARASPKLPRN